MIVRARSAAWLLTAAIVLGAVPALAGPGHAFVPLVDVRGTKLQLNGAGTRYKAIFKVYDMALYTTRKVGSPDELLALPGPKRLSFVALRELSGAELGHLLARGLADNSPADQVRRHAPSIARFVELFSGRDKLVSGDSFALEFVPGHGMQLYVAGQAQGQPVGDDEFFRMVLKIWVGRAPADPGLRDALLGKGA